LAGLVQELHISSYLDNAYAAISSGPVSKKNLRADLL